MGFLEINRNQAESKPVFTSIDLSGDSIAIMGLNGSGKSTYLKKFADSLIPKSIFNPNGYQGKYWKGGFIFSPEGLKNDIDEIFHPREHSEFGEQQFKETERATRKTIVEGQDKNIFEYVQNVTLNKEFLDEMNQQPRYLKVDYLLPGNLPISKVADWPDWRLNYYPELANELISQNRFVSFMHPNDDDGNYIDDFNVRRSPKPLVCRIIEITEDTKTARELSERIRRSLESIGNLEEITYDEMIGQILGGKEDVQYAPGTDGNTPRASMKFTRKLISLPCQENPLFTPMFLHFDFLVDNFSKEHWPNYCTTWAKNLGNIFLEWPQWRFQRLTGVRFDLKLFSAGVDPHLLQNKFHSDLSDFEKVSLCSVNLDLDLNSKKIIADHKTPEANARELLEKAETLLKEWQVTPYSRSTGYSPKESKIYENAWDFKFSNDNLVFNWNDEVNESTKRWIFRAIQVAGMLSIETPYKIVIWDEPEFGLHTSAVLNVKQRVLPYLKSHGIKVIFATHSTILGNSADQILKCIREHNYPHTPQLQNVPAINEEVLEDLGITKFDILGSIRKILIVEGDHDKFVLDILFGEFLQQSGIKIFTLGGTHQLLGLTQSQIIMEYLDADIFILTDGLNRSILNLENRSFLDKISDAFVRRDLKSANELLVELDRAGYDKDFEISKLIPVLKIFLGQAKNKKIDIGRINFLMLGKNDILHYLDPTIVISGLDLLKFSNWESIWEIRKLDNKKRLNEKEYIRRELGGEISQKSIKKATRSLLDKALDPDFQKLINLLS